MIGVSLLLSLTQFEWAAGAGVVDQQTVPLTIVIYTHSYVDVPRWELQPAIEQTTRALRAAGILAEWRNQPDHGPAPRPNELTLLLLSAEMTARKCALEDIGPRVLGTSAPAAARAWIFLDRVTTVANRLGLAVVDILGQVITHELGHLLLGHAAGREAVMREQVLLTGAGYFRFSRKQAEQMQARLRKTENLVVGALTR